MKLHTKELGNGILVIHLDGKLNMIHAPHLRTLIDSHIAAGNNRISLDLTNVDFIDSSGLGALINALKVTRQADGDLRIAAPTEQVKLILGLTNLDRVMKIYPDAETAFNE